MIPAGDVANLRAAFAANPNDLGVGLYNPSTGEIRVGSFDKITKGQGHQGLANALGITNNSEWRGFILRSDGTLHSVSHFNLIDGNTLLTSGHEIQVRLELQRVGLLS